MGLAREGTHESNARDQHWPLPPIEDNEMIYLVCELGYTWKLTNAKTLARAKCLATQESSGDGDLYVGVLGDDGYIRIIAHKTRCYPLWKHKRWRLPNL